MNRSVKVEYYDKLILGRDAEYTSCCEVTGLNNNCLVVGSAGSGKTLSIVEPRILEAYGSSLVVTLSKRRILDMYKPILEKRGYKVFCLNFADPSASTAGWDPLDVVAGREEEDIAFLAQSLVMANPDKQRSNADPYWSSAATSLLTGIIAYVLETASNASFPLVLDMLDQLNIDHDGDLTKTSLDRRFDSLARKKPGCYAVRCWNTFRNLPIRTSLCVFSELNSSLDKVFPLSVRQQMRIKPKVDFARMGMERTALFVVTSPVNPALHQIINVFYSQLIKELFEFAELQTNGLPVPVHMIFDDFATGARIHNFSEIISCSRAARISFMLLLQSESQLQQMYGSAAAQNIEDNCDTIVFLGGNNIDTAVHMGIRANIPTEEMLSLPLGWEYVFRRGEEPLFTERFATLDDSRYRALLKAYEQKAAKEPIPIARWEHPANGLTEDESISRRKPVRENPETTEKCRIMDDAGSADPTTELNKLINASKELARNYKLVGEPLKQAKELYGLANLYFNYFANNDAQVQDEVFKLACQLVDIGALSYAERVMDDLYRKRCSAFGVDDSESLKDLALICLIQEKAGAHRKAKSSLAKLKSLASSSMPTLVKRTEEMCRHIRSKIE